MRCAMERRAEPERGGRRRAEVGIYGFIYNGINGKEAGSWKF